LLIGLDRLDPGDDCGHGELGIFRALGSDPDLESAVAQRWRSACKGSSSFGKSKSDDDEVSVFSSVFNFV